MFIVLLKFSENRHRAGELMAGHNSWIQHGFDDGVFLLVGAYQPKLGGTIIATNISLPELQSRVNNAPFVAEKVVTAEILEISPAKAVEQLAFLLD